MATFSIMVSMPPLPEFQHFPLCYMPHAIDRGKGIEPERAQGMTDRDVAMQLAQSVASETGRHVRVYVDGCNYDTAEYGPRPVGYKPRSAVSCRPQKGVPLAPLRR
jgi:hypothetical protein